MKFGSVVSVWMRFLNHLQRISLRAMAKSTGMNDVRMFRPLMAKVLMSTADGLELRRAGHEEGEPVESDEVAFAQRQRRLVVEERVYPTKQRQVTEQHHQDEQRGDQQEKPLAVLLVVVDVTGHLLGFVGCTTISAALRCRRTHDRCPSLVGGRTASRRSCYGLHLVSFETCR